MHSGGSTLQRPALRRIAKPWGEEVVLSRSAAAVCKVLRIRRGERLSLQYHRRKRETLIMLRGSALLTLGERLDALALRQLARGERIVVEAGTIHRLEALAEGAEVLEFAFDASADGDDVVRLEDDYGRANEGVGP